MSTVRAISRKLSHLTSIAPDTAIFLIMNQREHTVPDSRIKNSLIETEFYDEAEIDLFISHLRALGAYVHFFHDDLEFVSFIENSKDRRLRHPYKIAYSLTNNGWGASRRCLTPAYCMRRHIAYANSHANVEGLARNKFHIYALCRATGLPAPQTWLLYPDGVWYRNAAPPVGKEIITKATHECGSIGVEPELIGPYHSSMVPKLQSVSNEISQPLIVQEFIHGSEYEVPLIVGDASEPLGVAEISFPPPEQHSRYQNFLSYQDVHLDHYAFNAIPPDEQNRMCEISQTISDLIGFRGICRVDFRGTTEHPYITDISAIPDIRPGSSFDLILTEYKFSRREILALPFALTHPAIP